ncbi:hypothetical protein OG819_42950 [Streptomyces sp. NBC_01549]|uniref:hypothetical protein n=1 Tax=Streptomyces sp. NBC_01549 TaxID=2975874 RepID=UPI00224E82A9|nr:hypothetical protein [Streptomyces sp. NBC_01549]MCX4596177.1 hypothetical protein [Streptomyces sp. NBC_01549]
MGMELADYGPKPTTAKAVEQRKAAIRIADQIGKEHPHPLDDEDPAQAGRELAKDPAIAAGVLELADQLGIRPDQIRRPA